MKKTSKVAAPLRSTHPYDKTPCEIVSKCTSGKVCDIRLEEDPCEAKNCPIDQRSACAFNKQNNTRCECMAGNKLKGCSCESGYRFSDNGTNGNCELVDFVWLQWHIKGTMNVDMARGKHYFNLVQ